MNILHYYRKLSEKSRTFFAALLSGRRIDLFLLIAAAVVLVLFALRRTDGTLVDKPESVSIITVSLQGERWFGAETFNAIIREFEENNAGLKLELTTQENADIVFFDDGELGSLIRNSALASLTPYTDDSDQWALPLVSFMDLFYYNIDILKAADCDRPPKTRAEFLAAAQAVAGNNKQVYAFALGLNPADPLALRRDLYPWIWTGGGEIYTEGDSGPVLSRAAVDAIAFLGRLDREGLLAPGSFEKTGQTRLEEFAAGKIAMMTASAREIAFLRRSAYGVNFGITAIPSAVQDKNRLGLSGIYAGISGNCPLPEEAWRFLVFVADKGHILAAALAAVPGGFPSAFLDEYIEQDPMYSKAWDIFEAAEIVEYHGGQAWEADISNNIRERLSEALQ